MNNQYIRVRSIDAFRAVTMFLMIFVNDLEGVPNVPEWLNHAGDNVDALGLADVIFPAFLFIVGLSIPFAFQNREQSGRHVPFRIITRSLALMLIGFFHANMETYDDFHTLLPKPVWESLVTFSFFFIFLDYRDMPKIRRYILQGIGIAILIAMSVLYRSNDPNHGVWLHFSWWGILGLIGWSYLFCALIYHYSKGVLWIQVAAWIVFLFINIDFHFGWLSFIMQWKSYIWLAGNGAMQAFTMAGVVVSVMYMRLMKSNELKLLWPGIILLAIILGNLGFIVRYIGGISKARDTPSWLLMCTSISLLTYLVFLFLVDVKQKFHWFNFIKPAGTNTFTCYIIPFIFYPIYGMTDYGYPEYLSEGMGGLIKCLVFSFLMIWVAGLLSKINIRLKI
ncbi:heparan-alpha-glucosaminide N-acetyltransferase domain-containing protein [Mucilaginibacter terrae]|uniref:Acyltransferase n=1 Tax=Mucilaginibacter terrae TaxID=1955052 RepID=A0ABU3GT22_9SPHI|nr:heparan-alpha-glucosaminide N-acetyltransferase domain-containing protein [Mucilaginibacter terrae]MDT3402923.1 putative acyltransferase [Mucilaginibacter terrae]